MEARIWPKSATGRAATLANEFTGTLPFGKGKKMEIGVGLDGGLGLSLEQQRELSREAARLGYTSIWTNEGAGEDCVLNCTIRWEASAEVVPGGLTTGIAVSPVGLRTPMGFALSAGTLSRHSGGRFILGIGTGGSYQPAYRNTWGMHETSSLRLMRDYI